MGEQDDLPDGAVLFSYHMAGQVLPFDHLQPPNVRQPAVHLYTWETNTLEWVAF
jgi:hypothetical protein